MPRERGLRAAIRVLLAASLVLSLAQPVMVAAAPHDGVVVGGIGSISQTGNLTLIQQQTHRLAIDWQGFDVAVQETVRFRQPSASSAALNRVLDGNPSTILGRIEANGQVFLMNPSGIIFGRDAVVNVGALVAGALDMDSTRFMTGVYEMDLPDGVEPGMVVNQGLIEAATGGSVTLVGGAVKNEGTIIARMGQVNLGAGRKAIVDFEGNDAIRFEVDGEITEKVYEVEAAVSNTGTIEVEGGTVIMSAKTARDVFSQVVNNEGIVRAGGIDTSGGEVRLVGSGGLVRNTGILDASGTAGGRVGIEGLRIASSGRILAGGSAGDGGSVTLQAVETTTVNENGVIVVRATGSGKGGLVEVIGEQVAVTDDVQIDANGVEGGGEVLIGGDPRAEGPEVRNADRTLVTAHVRIDASATGSGDGGKVIAWAEIATDFSATVTARGGPDGGNGGSVEVSGEHLAFDGRVDLSAPAGELGEVLLDPSWAQIVGGAGGGGTSGPDELITEASIEGAIADVTILADQRIDVAGRFTSGELRLPVGRDLTLATAGTNPKPWVTPGIFLDASDDASNLVVSTNMGALTISGATAGASASETPVVLTRLSSSAGDVNVSTATGDIEVLGSIETGSGDITLTPGVGKAVILDNGAAVKELSTTGGGNILVAGDLVLLESAEVSATALLSNPDVVLQGDLTTAGAQDLSVVADGDISLADGVRLDVAGGHVQVSAGDSLISRGTTGIRADGIGLGDGDMVIDLGSSGTLTLTVVDASEVVEISGRVDIVGTGGSLIVNGDLAEKTNTQGSRIAIELNDGDDLVDADGSVSLDGVAVDSFRMYLSSGSQGLNRGSIRVSGVLNTILSTGNGDYDLALIGGGTLANGGAVVFQNKGRLTLGSFGSNRLTFDNGMTALVPSEVDLAGRIAADGNKGIVLGDVDTPVYIDASSTVGNGTTGQVDLENVLLSDGVTLGVVNNTGAVGIESVGLATGAAGGSLTLRPTGPADIGIITIGTGTVTVSNSVAGVDFNGQITAGSVVISGTEDNQTVAFNAPLSLSGQLSSTDTSGGFTLDLGSQAHEVGSARIEHAGTLKMSGGSLTTTDGTAGHIDVTSTLRLAGTVSIDTTSSDGHIFLAGVQGGANALTLQAGNGDVKVSGDLTVAVLDVDDSHDVELTGGATIATDPTFANSGRLTLGDDGSKTFTFGNGVAVTAPTEVRLGGTIVAGGDNAIVLGDADTRVNVIADSTVGDANTAGVYLANVLLTDGARLEVVNHAGEVTIESVALGSGASGGDLVLEPNGVASIGSIAIGTGAVTVTNSLVGVDFNGQITAGSVTISDTADNRTVAFNAPVNLSGALRSSGAHDYRLDLTDQAHRVGSATIEHGGTLSLAGGIETTDGGNIEIATATLLTGPVTFDTDTASADGDIRLAGIRGPGRDLLIDAGDGAVQITDPVGGTGGDRIGSLTVHGATVHLGDGSFGPDGYFSVSGNQVTIGAARIDIEAADEVWLTGDIETSDTAVGVHAEVTGSDPVSANLVLAMDEIHTLGGDIRLYGATGLAHDIAFDTLAAQPSDKDGDIDFRKDVHNTLESLGPTPGNGFTLTIADGNVELDPPVLSDITPAGRTEVVVGAIVLDSDRTYTGIKGFYGGVILAADITLTIEANDNNLAGLRFYGSLDTDGLWVEPDPWDLTIALVDPGVLLFNGVVGGEHRLGLLDIWGVTDVEINQPMRADTLMLTASGVVNGSGPIAAQTIDLTTGSGMGTVATPLGLDASEISAATETGDVVISNAYTGGGTVDVKQLETGTGLAGDAGSIAYSQSGGSVSFDQVLTNTISASDGEGDIALSLSGPAGTLTIAGVVEAGGAGDIGYTTIDSDDPAQSDLGILLIGTTMADGDAVTMDADGAIDGDGLVAAQTVTLTAATGIGATSELDLVASIVNAETETGSIAIHNTAIGSVQVGSLRTGTGLAADAGTIAYRQSGGSVSFDRVLSDTASVIDGDGDVALSLSTPAGTLAIAGAVEAGGAGDIIYLTNDSDVPVEADVDIQLVGTGTTTALGSTVTMAADGAIDGGGPVTAQTVILAADTGIGAATELELVAGVISADTGTGAIAVHNTATGTVQVSTLETGTGLGSDAGAIAYRQSGGSVSFGQVLTDTTSASDGVGDVTLSLASPAGTLTIAGVVQAGGAGDVLYLTTDSDASDQADVAIRLAGTGTTTALGDSVMLDAAGAIDGNGGIIARTVSLDAVTGIGAVLPLELAAQRISAESTNGDIDMDNTATVPVTDPILRTGVGNIRFDQLGPADLHVYLAQTGDGTIDITSQAGLQIDDLIEGHGDVQLIADGDIWIDEPIDAGLSSVFADAGGSINGSALVTAAVVDLHAVTGIGDRVALELATTLLRAFTVDGDIDLDNHSTGDLDLDIARTGSGNIHIDQSGGGTLIVSTVQSADGDIVLNGTGNLVLLDAVTATGDLVRIGAGGAIDGDATITAAVVELGAGTGIGTDGPIGLATRRIGAETGRGGVSLHNASDASVTATLLKSGGGDIDIVQTGTGALRLEGVEAGGDGDVSGTVTGGIVLAGPITASGDEVTLTSLSGDINGDGPVSARVVDLDARCGIGSQTPLQLQASLIGADTTFGAIAFTNRTDFDATVASATTGNGDVMIAQRGDSSLYVGRIVADRIVLDAEGRVRDGNGDDLNLSASVVDLTAGRDIGAGNPLDVRTSALMFDVGSGGIGVDNLGSLRLEGTSTSGPVSVSAHSLSVVGTGVTSGGDIELSADSGWLTLWSDVTGKRDITLFGNTGVRQNADVRGRGGDILVSTAIANPKLGAPSGGGITMAPGTMTESIGGSIEYLANNTIVIGLLDTGFSPGTSVSVTAVNGDVLGNGRDHGIKSAIVTVQAINGKIGASAVEPLLIHSGASEINLATSELSYVDSMDGLPIDTLINDLPYAVFYVDGVRFSIPTLGGQIVVLSSVAREASASVQQAAEEEIEETADALLKEEIEIYTVQADGVELPEDQRDEVIASEAAADIIVHLRPSPLLSPIWADLAEATGGVLRLDDPGASVQDRQSIEIIAPVGPFGSDASAPPVPDSGLEGRLSGPGLSWNGPISPSRYGIDDYAPRWFTGLTW